jgi:hypothetical protein
VGPITKLGATKLEPTDNAELLAIEREIDRLGAIEAEIEEKRIKPRENLWVGAMREPVGPRRRFKTSDEWWHNLALVDEVTGRNEAIQAQAAILAEREEAIDRLIATSEARTSPAPRRRASSFAISWRMDGDRRSPAGTYPERAVAILADLCGLSAKELTDR